MRWKGVRNAFETRPERILNASDTRSGRVQNASGTRPERVQNAFRRRPKCVQKSLKTCGTLPESVQKASRTRSERVRKASRTFPERVRNASRTRSEPRAFGRQLTSRWLFYFLLCYTVLTRANQLETAVHGCILIFGLVSIISLTCQYVVHVVRLALQSFELFLFIFG